MSQPRVAPLLPEELDPEQTAFLAPYMSRDGRLPNVFGTLARHLDPLSAWSEFGLYTMQRSAVDPVLREVAILRTALHVGNDYEWHHHREIGQRLGMTDSDFDAIEAGRDPNKPAHDLLIRCADDLAREQRLADPQ